MSTVGLTAQETALPTQNSLLWGCHSMAGSKSNWSCALEPNSFYFCVPSHACHGHRAPAKTTAPPPLSLERHKQGYGSLKFPPKKSRPHLPPLSRDDEPPQPAPHEPTHALGRCSKPLPPPPPLQVLEQMDSEADLSTDESCRLVSDHRASPFRYGLSCRRSFRDCGQVNHAYYDGPAAPPQPDPRAPTQEAACQQDRAQRRLQRSHSGPAGSFHKHSQVQRAPCPRTHADKHGAPPPVPPRSGRAGDLRRWSVEVRPPRVPPKSLPTYSNGVMPSTQSFAPDPNYVSVHRQNSEGAPCILPVMVEGVKDSDTHYHLMPAQDCAEKLFSAAASDPQRGVHLV